MDIAAEGVLESEFWATSGKGSTL